MTGLLHNTRDRRSSLSRCLLFLIDESGSQTETQSSPHTETSATSSITASCWDGNAKYMIQITSTSCLRLYKLSRPHLWKLRVSNSTNDSAWEFLRLVQTMCWHLEGLHNMNFSGTSPGWMVKWAFAGDWPADLPFCLSLAAARFCGCSQLAPLAAMSITVLAGQGSLGQQRQNDNSVTVCGLTASSSLLVWSNTALLTHQLTDLYG